MSIKILSALFLAFITLNFVSCSQDPSAIGSAFLNKDLINLDSLDSYKDTLPQYSYTYKYVIPLAYSNSLLLGQKGNNVATTLLAFNFIIPDSIKADLLTNSLQVTSATVQLTKFYTYGDSLASIDYSVHSINASSAWTTTFTIDSLSKIQYDAEDVSSNKSFTDTLYQFNLKPALALSWLSDYANSKTDNGIIVIPQNSNKIVGFYALSSSTNIGIPYLNVVLSKPGVYTNDTLKFSSTADVSVVSGNIPQNQNENIYVQSSVTLESNLRFDLSKVPQHAVINYAELQLTIDSTQSLFGSPFTTDQLLAYYITDSTRIDSSLTNEIPLSRSGSIYKGNVTSYVQNWLSSKINEGIQIKANTYGTGVELWALKGSNASDPAKRPRLKIIYTNKK